MRTGVDAKRLLADQLTAPVRWVACMQAAAELAPGATFVEIGPGTVLSGLVEAYRPGGQGRDSGHRRRGRAVSPAMAHSIDLSGKTAFVTGSTRGIGLAIGQTLYAAGAKVAVVGRDAARAREVASAMGSRAVGRSLRRRSGRIR